MGGQSSSKPQFISVDSACLQQMQTDFSTQPSRRASSDSGYGDVDYGGYFGYTPKRKQQKAQPVTTQPVQKDKPLHRHVAPQRRVPDAFQDQDSGKEEEQEESEAELDEDLEDEMARRLQAAEQSLQQQRRGVPSIRVTDNVSLTDF